MVAEHRIAISGAAGQISYSLLFRIAAGEMLGSEQPIILSLLEIPPAMQALEGVAMELQDGAFPLLHSIELESDAKRAFRDANSVVLVGAYPRRKGMERRDLLDANARIFVEQGRALNDHAADDVRVLVVGNPANTNARIAQRCAPRLPPHRFSAMTQLDHNRACALLAAQAGVDAGEVDGVIIWGNHSTTQYPDLHHATIHGNPALEQIDGQWYREQFISAVQKRGAAVIEARGSSSAASAANAALQHMRTWILGTPPGQWTSMGIVSNGAYDIEAGLVYSMPVRCVDGDWQLVENLECNGFSRQRMDDSAQELRDEAKAVDYLLD